MMTPGPTRSLIQELQVDHVTSKFKNPPNLKKPSCFPSKFLKRHKDTGTTSSANCQLRKTCETCESLRNEKPICESLRNLYLRKLAKTRICETLRILRNKRKTAKLVFAKLAKHHLRNLAKHCETLIAKIAKIAKIELQCETITQITK